MKQEMKTKIFTMMFLVFAAACFIGNSLVLGAIIPFEDGKSYTIDHTLYQSDMVILDQLTVNDPGTHLDLVDGGDIWDLATFNKSTVEVSGGLIGDDLSTWGSSTVDIFGGTISGSLRSDSYSTVNVYGGYVEHLRVNGSSAVTLTGGDINSASVGVNLSDDATITFVCDLDSLNFSYDQGLLVGVTGNWLDSSSFDVEIQNLGYDPTSDYIHFVPEPVTVVLFGLGSLFLRTRKH